jgi:hypothetical protein
MQLLGSCGDVEKQAPESCRTARPWKTLLDSPWKTPKRFPQGTVLRTALRVHRVSHGLGLRLENASRFPQSLENASRFPQLSEALGSRGFEGLKEEKTKKLTPPLPWQEHQGWGNSGQG